MPQLAATRTAATGTVRDALEEFRDQDVVIVIPIGGDADEFK